ncbi:DMT family transporter [Hydrogenophaga sp.]|uniref:DMT family transporter n=1 Tax=Hydrogenophaga sp. TaxID=1904254 RepID=UPI00272F4F6E|nr:DMT family transporter [Hydrogenophaga sp.]MDP2017662.1 DMT family transporter [Hydrogenophaga sp.]MDP3166881.1 DMT family transporter [Hydrogenophaga sp.]MDP3811521.1 DMT family transporter [Hydrogenophaga sp.]
MNRWWAYASLALSMALVGSYVALSKPLVLVFPIFLLAWLRFGIGGLAMWRWLKKPANEPPISPRTRRLLFLESFLGNFLFSICMLFGVSMTTAVAAGVVMSSIPAVVAVLSWMLLRERIGWRSVAGIACAAIGIGLFSLQKVDSGTVVDTSGPFGISRALLGNLLVFAAVVCEASYVVIGKRLTEGLGPKRISAIINLWGFALVTPFGLWAAWSFDFGTVTAPIWTLLVFYALAASVWTVWLWMTGLKTVPASQAGVFTVMLPVSAAAIGVLFMGESLSPVQMIAFGIALLGLMLATLPSRNAKAA